LLATERDAGLVAETALMRAEGCVEGGTGVTGPHHPAGVLFRVGQVIRHKRYGYKGVISGWDRKFNATQEWQVMMRVRGGVGNRE
jgi:hypothetical protein